MVLESPPLTKFASGLVSLLLLGVAGATLTQGEDADPSRGGVLHLYGTGILVGIMGIGVAYFTLFTRRAMVFDTDNRRFIDSSRGLIGGSSNTVVPFDDIVEVGVGDYPIRIWTEGEPEKTERASALWLEVRDALPKAVGAGERDTVDELARELGSVIGVPVRRLSPEESPPSDVWT